MGRTYDAIDERLARFVESQPVFFVATAPLQADGLVNCSPKGNRDELMVTGPRQVAYLDQTGSGVETIAHLRENGRIVIMVCSFAGPPRIVRIHGRGEVITVDDPRYEEWAARFPGRGGIGVRAVVAVEVSRVADSCGYGVPLMEFTDHRKAMDQWAEGKGVGGIGAYQSEKNVRSLDGLPGLQARSWG